MLLLFLVFPVSAQTMDEVYQEQLEASGGRELIDQLPYETRELLDSLGITSLDPETVATADTGGVLRRLWKLVVAAAGSPLRSCGIVLGVVLVHAWISGMGDGLGDGRSGALFSIVAVLSACAAVVTPVASCITVTAEATESLSVFMMSFVPVYAGILFTSGHTLSALSFQSIVLYVSQLLSLLSQKIIVPLMGVSLSLGVIGSVTPQTKLGRVGDGIGKTATWLLSLGTLLFSGLLSLQNLTGSAADTLGNRVLRFSLSSFVPVVGGSLSEAFSTVKSSLGVLRSTTGAFGIAAAAAIVLPPLLSCAVWSLGLSLCRMCADVFELNGLSDLLRSVRSVVNCLIGVLCAGALFAIIAVTVVSTSAGG